MRKKIRGGGRGEADLLQVCRRASLEGTCGPAAALKRREVLRQPERGQQRRHCVHVLLRPRLRDRSRLRLHPKNVAVGTREAFLEWVFSVKCQKLMAKNDQYVSGRETPIGCVGLPVCVVRGRLSCMWKYNVLLLRGLLSYQRIRFLSPRRQFTAQLSSIERV
jgi:hypothetical protein